MELTRAVERAQSIYARWLAAGTWLGIALLVTGFLAYVTGTLPAYVPLDQLPGLWGLPLGRYLSMGCENFGEIESFEKTPSGVRMNYFGNGGRISTEASLAIVAAWLVVSFTLALRLFRWK